MKYTLLLSIFIAAIQAFQSQETIPELNQQIFLLTSKQVGKKVGRGECWDLAQLVLNESKAKWDGLYDYGKKLNYKKDQIFPGDIIQFEKVVLKYQDGDKIITLNFYHHTAIVYEVLGNNVFKVAQQNTEKGKKVTVDVLNLNFMTKGKIDFYRPKNK